MFFLPVMEQNFSKFSPALFLEQQSLTQQRIIITHVQLDGYLGLG